MKQAKGTLFGLVLVLGLFLIPGTTYGRPMLSLGGVYVMPADSEMWDDGYGGELKLMLWPSHQVGVALAAGYQQWNATDKSLGTVRLLGSGSADLMPVGASVLFRGDLGTVASFVIEAGLRYVIVDADLPVYYARADFRGRGITVTEGESELKVDDGIIGLLGLDLVFENIPLFIGVGYQVDMDKGDAKLDAARFQRENELAGFFVRAGFAW